MLLSLIVAFDKDRVIGRNGELPWKLPRDLQRFKSLSVGKTIIMGRKTHQSIGRVLPERKNVVITNNPQFVQVGCPIFSSLDAALKGLEAEEEVFIIGGESLYRESIPLASIIYLTEVEGLVNGGDTFFPMLEADEWRAEVLGRYPPDQKNNFGMTFKVLHRR